MDPKFWLERWQLGEIGFHQADMNADLLRHWPAVAPQPRATVFVPLCGKSLDMLWLRERGHPVVGIELSGQAIREFFDERQLTAVRTGHGALQRHTAGGYTLYCGDFFELRAQDLRDCPYVYDRAALIALPVAMRARYASHLATLLAPATRTLLITMCYPQQQMTPPPHSVCEPEVQSLYATDFKVQLLASRNTLEDELRLRARGLQQLFEQSYLLTRR
jgi:thiopurine S-methyltransferase